MKRFSSSLLGLLAATGLVMAAGDERPAVAQNFQMPAAYDASRVGAAKAVLADFDRYLDDVEALEKSFEKNRKAFDEIQQQMQNVSSSAVAADITQQAVAMYRQMLRAEQQAPGGGGQVPPAINRWGFGRLPTQDQLLQLEQVEATLQLQQLSSVQLALARQQIECVREAVRLIRRRDELEAVQRGILRRLWEFADQAATHTREENTEMLAAFAEVSPENSAGILVRGLLHQRLGDIAAAEADFEAAIAAQSVHSPAAVAARGRLRAWQGLLDEAKRDVSNAHKLAGEDPCVCWLLASTYASMRSWKAAEGQWRKVAAAGDFDVAAHRALSLVNYEIAKDRRSSLDEALEHGKLASSLAGGEDWLAELALALAYSAGEDRAMAAEHLEKAIELSEGEHAKSCLAFAPFIRTGRPADTMRLWSW